MAIACAEHAPALISKRLQDERMLLKAVVQKRHTECLVLAMLQVQQVLQLVSILLAGG